MVKNVLMKVRPMASCRFPPEGEGAGWCWWLGLVAVLFFLTEKNIGCPNGGGSCKLEMIEHLKGKYQRKNVCNEKKGCLVYKGDEILPRYNKPLKSLLNNQYNGKYEGFCGSNACNDLFCYSFLAIRTMSSWISPSHEFL